MSEKKYTIKDIKFAFAEGWFMKSEGWHEQKTCDYIRRMLPRAWDICKTRFFPNISEDIDNEDIKPEMDLAQFSRTVPYNPTETELWDWMEEYTRRLLVEVNVRIKRLENNNSSQHCLMTELILNDVDKRIAKALKHLDAEHQGEE